MILPLAGVPTRKTYGPKVTNIYDDGYDDDDHDDMSMEMADDENTTPLRGVSVDNGFRDELFLHEGRTVNFYCLSTFEHMNNMDWTQPADGSKCPSQIVVSISPFFRQTSNRTQDICALGLFVNTGHSYSVVLDHTLADPERLATTKLAKLLVDPSIRRISFRLQGLVHALNDKLGFPIGNFVDLDTLDDDNNTFDGMFKEYLHNWPSAAQYHTAKDEFTQISGAKKFNGSPWTRTTVPLGCLTFSACQGAMWHALDRAISQR
ncbi:hypothetical protein BC940DRAFT_298415 [Gongronella butleri]|nr:hypothetical protein BC940DRAFT_298415 [Gongronella butleri]